MKRFLLLIIVLFFFTSCKSVKDGLTGSKQTNTDEFLIKKKNPLVEPPEFGNLPKPLDNKIKPEDENEFDIELLIKNKKSYDEEKVIQSGSGSIEKIISEKIKNK